MSSGNGKDGSNGGGRDDGDQSDGECNDSAPDSGEQKEADYKVGFKKPPPEHRWKRGQSGNPKGRPKKPKPDVVEIVDRLMSQPVTIRAGGRTREERADLAADLAQINKAIQGDQIACAAVIRRMKKLRLAAPANDPSKPRGALVVRRDPVTPEKFEEMLEALRERQAKIHAETQDTYIRRGPSDE